MSNERKKERDRIAAERMRRRKGVEPCKGTVANCEECGSEYTRMVKHNRYCSDACRTEVGRRNARERSRAKARERNAPKQGTPMVCGHCEKEFIRDASRVAYCPDCRVLQKKNALPSLKEYNKSYKKVWHKERMKTNPVYAIERTVRSSIGDAIKRMGYTKRNRCYEILGCSWEFFKGYIEAKFQPGMTWENRGTGWELDHIIPVASAKSEEEVLKLNHYTNFQPLWKEQNREKGAKLDWIAP